MFNILIVDGNEKSINDANIQMGGRSTGEGYADTLRSLEPDLHCTIVKAADPGGDRLPAGVGLQDFDGAAITGSALNFYRGGAPINQQLELSRQLFENEVPVFGSCWGLQIMVAALGGSVRLNPKGRELFIARNIYRTAAGSDHPLFDMKPNAFDVMTVHSDEVEDLPEGSSILASNTMSNVQALSIVRGNKHFWGVQYHPEFSLHDLSVIIRRYGQRLVDEGLFRSMGELDTFAEKASATSALEQDRATDFELGITPAVRDPDLRLAELKNWLETVLKKNDRRR